MRVNHHAVFIFAEYPIADGLRKRMRNGQPMITGKFIIKIMGRRLRRVFLSCRRLIGLEAKRAPAGDDELLYARRREVRP